MSEPGPSGQPPGYDDEDQDDEEIDETGALQIESSNVGVTRRRTLLSRIPFVNRGRKYGVVKQSSTRGLEGGGGGGRSLRNCFGFLPGLRGAAAVFGGEDTEEEPLLFALTWA